MKSTKPSITGEPHKGARYTVKPMDHPLPKDGWELEGGWFLQDGVPTITITAEMVGKGIPALKYRATQVKKK